MPTKTKKRALNQIGEVIITGGSSGIGEAFIKAMYNLNSHCVIFNLSRQFPSIKNELEPDESPGRLIHIPCDLSDDRSRASSLSSLREQLSDSGESPLLLINNSGFGLYGDFPSPNADMHRKLVRVNIEAPLTLTAELLPELRKRGGVVLNVASTAAFQPTPYLATYGASKSFLRNWSMSLNEELRGSGVLVSTLCPGPTATQFFSHAGFESSPLPKQFGMTATDVVKASLEGVEKGKSLIVPGISNKILTFFAPKLPITWVSGISRTILGRIRK